MVLRQAALAADAQQPLVPGTGQYLYVEMLLGSRGRQNFSVPPGPHPLSRFYVETLEQSWTSQTGPNQRTWTDVGQPEFMTQADRKLWEEGGSPPIGTGYGNGPPGPYYDVTGLPTDPSHMAAYFASQSDLPVQSPEGRDALWDFSTAASFLENGASGRQRAALLDYMATIPGVFTDGNGITLGTKESGTILAIPSTTAGYEFQALIDPRSSQLLETRLVVSDPSELYVPTPARLAFGAADAPLAVGQAQNYEDFLYAGIADSSGSVPSGTPASPAPWPYGSSREPLPGTAY